MGMGFPEIVEEADVSCRALKSEEEYPLCVCPANLSSRKAAYSNSGRRGRVRGLNHIPSVGVNRDSRLGACSAMVGSCVDRQPVLDLVSNLNSPFGNRRRNNLAAYHWRRYWLGRARTDESWVKSL